MLVLSRKVGEAILFDLPNGETITVKVNRINGPTVRLAIDSPRDIDVRRDELPKRPSGYTHGAD